MQLQRRCRQSLTRLPGRGLLAWVDIMATALEGRFGLSYCIFTSINYQTEWSWHVKTLSPAIAQTAWINSVVLFEL